MKILFILIFVGFFLLTGCSQQTESQLCMDFYDDGYNISFIRGTCCIVAENNQCITMIETIKGTDKIPTYRYKR